MLILSVLLGSVLILFLLATFRAPIWLWTTLFIVVTAILWESYATSEQNFLLGIAGSLAVLFIILSISPIRRIIFVRPIFLIMKKRLSHISDIERQALDAGGAGFEKGFFSGRPDWEALRAIPSIKLTEEEKKFLDGPAEEMCRMINDWEIRHKYKKIPDYLWNFAKKHGFLGLRIPKKYGGLSFSFQAQSIILGKIASRSVDVSTIIGVSNSLGPDELIEKYGTKEQKNYYLPRLARGEEITAFAITSPAAGSDVPAMRDIGKLEYGIHKDKKVLGVRLTWDKRYITFAPNATLITLAFHLLDPDNLLNRGTDIGITLALIPANHPGVRIGRRHLPSGAAFPNGPIWGEDVFIPIDWIIGGVVGAGTGWKMIMESLFVGRAISLPSMSVATIKAMLHYSTAYARIRRQFGSPIGTFEGVEEPLSRLTEAAYLTEAARVLAAAMVDNGERPIAVASLMKYQTTEYARRAINDAMDVYGGRAICDGPSNYILSAYIMAPIAVTVEGANIVTRSLITFAQGALRAHPYLYQEMNSCGDLDENQGLKTFEIAFLGHISLFISNICRTFFHNITSGIFGHAPKGLPMEVIKWYRQLWWKSSSFACISDITAIFLGGRLKKKQKISGRLADALSELYFISCVLKRYEDDGFPESDRPIVALCMKNGLYRFQEALRSVVHNFPNRYVRFLLRIFVLTFGANRTSARDNLGHDVVKLMLEPSEVRDRLTRYIFISKDSNDATGLLGIAFQKAVAAESAQKKLDLAVRSGKVRRVYGVDWIADAERQGILTAQESAEVREMEKLAERVIAVDHFDPNEV